MIKKGYSCGALFGCEMRHTLLSKLRIIIVSIVGIAILVYLIVPKYRLTYYEKNGKTLTKINKIIHLIGWESTHFTRGKYEGDGMPYDYVTPNLVNTIFADGYLELSVYWDNDSCVFLCPHGCDWDTPNESFHVKSYMDIPKLSSEIFTYMKYDNEALFHFKGGVDNIVLVNKASDRGVFEIEK